MKKLVCIFFQWALLAAVISLNGCVAASMHTLHPMSIRVTDLETKTPARHMLIKVMYDYDSYGVFHFLRTPDDVSGETGDDGVVVLPIADYRYAIIVQAGGTRFDLNKKLVRNGGIPVGWKFNNSLPPTKIELTAK